MASSAMPTPEASESVSSIGRIFGVFLSPKATFESIVRRPTWIVPFILICLGGVSVTWLFGQRVGWRGFMEKQIAASASAQRQFEAMTPEQREQAIEQRAKYAPAFGYALTTVGTLIVFLIIAGVFMAIFNMAGGQMRFVTSLGIVAYAWLPWLIHGLLGILTLFLKDPSTVDLQNLVASNPGALMSDDASKVLISALGAIDLFSFWTMILMGIGYSATNPKKISLGKAFGYVFAMWLLFVLVFKVGIPAIFS
jgi:hypothetical protein